MRTPSLVALALFALPAFGCSSPSAPASTDAGDARGTHVTAAEVDASADPRMPPLAAEWMEEIAVPGGGIVYVAPPVGSTEPRPVLVAVHGAVDDPGLACSAWRLITDVYPFVVCPGGTKLGKGKYVWPSSDAIDEAVDSALAAVRAKYGDRVATSPAIYAGFSQGANMAGPVLGKKKGRFASAVLSEGGYGAFESPALARAFVSAGGARVLFTCSQPGCAGSFERSRGPLVRAGADAKISYSGPYGHSMPPQVREAIHASLGWVASGVAGWETYGAAPKLPTH